MRFLVVALVASALVAGASAKCPNPATVSNFEVTDYLGRWYEIAVSAQFRSFFEKELQCTTALYSKGTESDAPVLVYNSGRYGAPDGPIKGANGTARVVSGAKLEVTFTPPSLGIYSPYWIVDLIGDANKGYQVSMVFSCNSILGITEVESFWILSRTPELPAGVTYESLMEKATALGIDVSSLGVTMTTQGGACQYY
eukprot:TRINITY_DN32294_c0_g1_i1.p1 TRINITY_DN32294_c0_g1~~TRINITY_DN32294_c0_g1_i1.p1  ORF type:complete len:213 (+),score=15.71 TRINITY_DN32294_c0_g1_i1:46-639(+)